MTLVITLEQSGFIGKSVWTYGSRSHLLILFLGRRLCRALFIGFLHRFPWSSLCLLLCYVFTCDRIAISRWHLSTLDSMSPRRRPFEASLQAYAHKVPGGDSGYQAFPKQVLTLCRFGSFRAGSFHNVELHHEEEHR